MNSLLCFWSGHLSIPASLERPVRVRYGNWENREPICGTSAKIIQVNEWGCRDGMYHTKNPGNKGNLFSNTITRNVRNVQIHAGYVRPTSTLESSR